MTLSADPLLSLHRVKLALWCCFLASNTFQDNAWTQFRWHRLRATPLFVLEGYECELCHAREPQGQITVLGPFNFLMQMLFLSLQRTGDLIFFKNRGMSCGSPSTVHQIIMNPSGTARLILLSGLSAGTLSLPLILMLQHNPFPSGNTQLHCPEGHHKGWSVFRSVLWKFSVQAGKARK